MGSPLNRKARKVGKRTQSQERRLHEVIEDKTKGSERREVDGILSVNIRGQWVSVLDTDKIAEILRIDPEDPR